MENENINNKMNAKPSAWFFAEWFSILGTFIVCFVFLFYQNQTQSQRVDELHKMYVQVTEKGDKKWIESMDRWANLLEKYSEIKCEKKS